MPPIRRRHELEVDLFEHAVGVAQAAGVKEQDCLVGIDGFVVTPAIAAGLGKQSSASLTFVRPAKSRHTNSRYATFLYFRMLIPDDA